MPSKWYHEWPYPDLAMYVVVLVVLALIGGFNG
jgi:hypothetical protein